MNHLIVVGTILLMGCTNGNSLYFGTYTRVGIDASADGAGIGAKNVALNITPPKDDGSAFDVLGTSDLDIAYTNVVIEEIVAVGDAAKCAAMKKAIAANVDSLGFVSGDPPAVGPVIFGAYSSWSLLDLSWSEATTPGINFGYKRGVGIRMPIVNDEIGSAFAYISVNTTNDDSIVPKSKIGGTRNKHTFATGAAAIIKASAEAQALNGGKSYAGCLN